MKREDAGTVEKKRGAMSETFMTSEKRIFETESKGQAKLVNLYKKGDSNVSLRADFL